MPYMDIDIETMGALITRIEEGKEHENAAPTYKDSPSLKEIALIALSVKDEEKETLENKIIALDYVCDCYYSMGRTGLSNKLYPTLLQAYVALRGQGGGDEEKQKDFETSFYWAVKARNYYEADDCADLIAIVKGSIADERVEELLESAKESRRGLPKYDPVEKTEEYLAVIDEVEQLIEENAQMKDFCMEVWSLKGQYLSERGIYWRSPVLLNPGFMFD